MGTVEKATQRACAGSTTTSSSWAIRGCRSGHVESRPISADGRRGCQTLAIGTVEIDNPRARLGEADVLAAFNRRRASEGDRAEVVERQDPPRLLLGASTIHSADEFDELLAQRDGSRGLRQGFNPGRILRPTSATGLLLRASLDEVGAVGPADADPDGVDSGWA